MRPCRSAFRPRPSILAVAVAGILMTTNPSHAQDCPAATPAEVEAVARAYFDAFNAGDQAALDKLLAADYRHQGAVVADQDRALHLKRLLAVRQGFPDGVYTIDWLVADGDKAVVRHTFRGTHKGEYTGIAATGKSVAVGAFHIHRIACGKIAETWNAGDGVGLFRQLGALSGPPTTLPDDEQKAPAATAPGADCPTTTPAENAALARRWYDEAINQGRLDVLDEMLTDDIVHHAALFTDTVGPDAAKASLAAIRAGLPDVRSTVDDLIASGDTVVIRWTLAGTHQAPFLGIPASGKKIDFTGINAFRFACGKIVEGWSEASGLALLRQLGALR